MKIIFFGTSNFAVPPLKALVNAGYEITAVITQPDKPTGRKQILTPSPVKITAEKLGIKVLQPKSLTTPTPKGRGVDQGVGFKQPKTLKSDEFFEEFKYLEPDICIVAAYGKIVPERYLNIPKYGFLNIHPSLLPKYRGPSPIQTAILDGIQETGVTIMVMDQEVDHGPILSSSKYQVVNSKGYKEIEKDLSELGAELLIETLPKYISGEIKPAEQDHGQTTFTKMLSREDGRIDWNQPAEKIYNQIRALNPEPGTWTTWNPLKSSGQSGKILNIKKAKLLNGKLELETVQLEGKRETPFREFLNGHPDFDSSKL